MEPAANQRKWRHAKTSTPFAMPPALLFSAPPNTFEPTTGSSRRRLARRCRVVLVPHLIAESRCKRAVSLTTRCDVR